MELVEIDCVTLVLCVKLVDCEVELVEIEVDCVTLVLVDSEMLVDSVRLVELDCVRLVDWLVELVLTDCVTLVELETVKLVL